MRISTKNMQAKEINQKRGPTTGNENPGSKRADFMSEKSKTGSEKSALANMVTDAVARRGELMRGYRDPAVEPLHSETNVGFHTGNLVVSGINAAGTSTLLITIGATL